VVEGNVYFPIAAVDQAYVRPNDRTTVCPWKGTASYWDIVVDGEVAPAAAWYYPEPMPGAEVVADRVAFYPVVSVARSAD
ncbi:MAG: DUF427 domain-containing protein, partial [Acidimicrobiales bacterium]